MRDRRIDVGDRRHALIDEVERFLPQRRLQTVCDMPFHFLPNMDWLLADRSIELQCAVDCIGRSQLSPHDLHERDHVGRVERVSDQYAFGMKCAAV